MKLKITDLSYESKWYAFEDAELEIRPYPFSQANVIVKDGAMVISGEEQCKIFKYCLTGWKRITDADGQPIPLTEEIKQKVYDFRLAGIADFVIAKTWEFRSQTGELAKNS